ncbi:MAG: ABC transporter permease [Chloroflexi bacterium]|nr:ABC transporter permease [Chloroflexota bacterium]
MTVFRQYVDLAGLTLRMYRQEAAFIAVIQVAMAVGFVLGFGYFIDNISENQAIFVTTGAATNTAVTVAIVGLPNYLAQGKAEGRLDYFLTLPVSREMYLLSQVTYVALSALPGIVFTIALGAWHYDLPLAFNPLIFVAIPLAMASLAGAGVALGVLSPHPVLTNVVTNLTVFYVLLFAPILIPKEQLPSLLQHTAVLLPTTYAADAVRGSLTDIAGTHLERSLLYMAGFSAVSLGAAAVSIRKRG